jgi:hypothetical protein
MVTNHPHVVLGLTPPNASVPCTETTLPLPLQYVSQYFWFSVFNIFGHSTTEFLLHNFQN